MYKKVDYGSEGSFLNIQEIVSQLILIKKRVVANGHRDSIMGIMKMCGANPNVISVIWKAVNGDWRLLAQTFLSKHVTVSSAIQKVWQI